jgi:Ca-activated chloride channel homolog
MSRLSIMILLLSTGHAQAQSTKTAIRNANKLYHEKQYQQAVAAYDNARTPAGMDPTANYNKGNALVRDNKLDVSVDAYDKAIADATEPSLKEKSFYNKGVAFQKQQKLDESITAWKDALKIDPKDQEARENLQKALAEKKKQEEKEKDKKKEQEKNKKDNKDQQKQQPQQNQSKLTKQQVEQLLKALQQKEKEIQQRLQKSNASPSSPDKDW